MELVIKAEADISVEGGEVVFRTFDTNGDTTFKHNQGLYDLIHSFVEMFMVPGTDQLKIDADDVEEFEALASELRDSLLLIETALGDH